MNQYELPAMLEDELPVISEELKKSSISAGANTIMKVFTGYTRKMLTLHDLPSVVRCMNIADKIYTKGNAAVKNAIENVFVYSFSSLRCVCNKVEWKVIQAKMPMTLYSIYVRQMYRSGI